MWWAPLLIWTSQESHLEPFQSSYRSQDQLFKQLSVIIKCMASERKLVRVVKSRKPPKGKSAMNKKLLEDRCQCPQSGVFHIIMSWDAALLEWSSWSRRRTLKLHRILLLITWTKKKPSGGKLCGHMKQKSFLPQWASICSEERRWGLQPQEHKTFCQAWCW